MQNQNQSRLGHTRFPALGAGYVYLLWVVIGLLSYFHLLWLANVIALVLVSRHSIENRSNTQTQWMSYQCIAAAFIQGYQEYTHIILFLFVLFFSRLIAVGEEFCSSTSEDLHDSIRTQTVKYFKTYHRSRMDELRMFLENDAWELCPVKASFKIVDLSVSRIW